MTAAFVVQAQAPAGVEQRWLEGRTSFVPPTDRFDPRAFDVAPIDGDAEARAFILAHHYSGTYPAARRRHGLYMRGELVGVAVFSHPCNDAVLTKVFPGPATDSIELRIGQFVFLAEVLDASNGRASWRWSDRPYRTNQSSEPRLHGWCGETNNRGLTARGLWCVARVTSSGERARVVQVDGRDLVRALERLGYGELLPDGRIAGTVPATRAYRDGFEDGLKWDLDGFDSVEAAAAQAKGWDESTINAVGASACARKWGVQEGGTAWSSACADYNDGVHDALMSRMAAEEMKSAAGAR